MHRTPFVVKEIIPVTPAELAGLQAGDSLVSINGENLTFVSEFSPVLAKYPLTEIVLGLHRNGEYKEVKITPDANGKIGTYLTPYYEFYNITKICLCQYFTLYFTWYTQIHNQEF